MKIRNRSLFYTVGSVAVTAGLLLSLATSPIPSVHATEVAIENYPSLAITKSEVTIQGYLIAPLNSSGTAFDATNKTNLALGASMDTAAADTIPIQLKEPLRSQFNLVDHPELVGKLVRITGTSDTYMKRAGIKPATAIEIVDSSSTNVQPPTSENTTTESNDLVSTPIATVRSGAQGTEYTVSGKIISLVNGWGGNGFYLQGSDGAGIYIYPGAALGYQPGDTVQLTGTLGEYKGELQLTTVSNHKAISEHFNAPITETNIAQLATQAQATLVSLKNLTVGDIQSDSYQNSTFTVTDSEGQTVDVRLDSRTGIKTADLLNHINKGDKINLTAILSTYNGKIQLKPFDLSHFEVVEKATTETAPGKTETVTVGHIQGASHQSPLTNQSVILKNVVVTYVTSANNFYVQDVTPDGDVKTSDGINIFTDKLKTNVKVGDLVTIAGRVEEYLGKGYTERGETDLTITQIRATEVTVDGTAPVPSPIVLGLDRTIPADIIDNDGLAQFDPEQDALDFWESVEGMVVAVDDAKILGPLKNKEIYVTPATSQLPLNNVGGVNLRPEGNNTNIIPLLLKNGKQIVKSGDYFTGRIAGPVTYSYTNYKVYVDDSTLPTLHEGATKPETTTIIPNDDKLTVASYNIENFSADSKSTSDAKVQRIAKSFVSDLHSPDIIGLIEVQDNNGATNDGTTDANKSAERLIAAIQAAGGPTYTYVDIAPENNKDGGQEGGNIRVGFLYNSKRVSLSDKPIGTATQAVAWENGELNLSLGRIDPTNPAWAAVRKTLAAEFVFKGEKVVVLANHLNSKRGDNGLYGKIQPISFKSEEKRHILAQTIADFTKAGLAQNPNANIVMLGDFNDYEFTKTIEILETGGMANLVSRHDASDRFSYFYNGNNQSLDNMLVSTNLLERYTFDMVHVNSAFMEEHGRASDHDPLLVQLDVTKAQEPTQPEPSDKQTDDSGTVNNSDDNGTTNNNKPTNLSTSNQTAVNADDRSGATDKGQTTVTPTVNNSQKKILPKTGEETSFVLITIGLVILSACLVKKQKES
ncbi:TPA: LPXTG cell wall anchor domain-containing protein [Streptococcus suis]|nr:LPXTG cell wall anchor domain-containing protein [Streptococcus suis]HEM3584567.1 LPXTG cell wall anchor domain-containing protein [Streptococcus suis]